MARQPKPEPAPLEHEHSPEAIRARLRDGQRPNYLRDFVYGGIDGAVTTFAVVSGVSGAALSDGIIIILGVANLLADGFSMDASNFQCRQWPRGIQRGPATLASVTAEERIQRLERAGKHAGRCW